MEAPDDITLSYSRGADIEEMSRRIATCGPDLLDKWSSDNPFVVHVKTTQGTGKSTGLAERIAYYAGFTGMFAPRHADIKNDIQTTPLGNIFKHHFRGKDRICENDSYKGKHQEVSKSISQDWCRGCSRRDSCEYFTAYRRVGSWDPSKIPKSESQKLLAPNFMAVHQHIIPFPDIFSGSENEDGAWDHLKAVIIDESPYESVVTGAITIRPEDIRAELDVIGQITADDPQTEQVVEGALEVLELTRRTVEDDRDTKPLYENWKEFKDRVDTTNSHFEREYGEQWGEQSNRAGTPFVLSILGALPDIETVIDEATTEGRSLNREQIISQLWKVSARDSPELTVSFANLEALRRVARTTPTFVLATEWPTEIAEVVFDIPVVEVSDGLSPSVDGLQLASAKAGISALRENKRLASNLRELTTMAVVREALQGRKTLIVSKKEEKEKIHDLLTDEDRIEEDDYELAHYYGLTGSNQYEDCGAVVLHGAPGYPDALLNRNHQMTGIPKDELRAEKREGELRDALHRTRPAQKEGVRAYVWSSHPDFRDEFAGEWLMMGVPQLRDKIEGQIESENQRRDDEQYVIDELQQLDGWITGTEFKENVGEAYLSARDRLVEDDRIEFKRESNGVGRPTKKYRYRDPHTD